MSDLLADHDDAARKAVHVVVCVAAASGLREYSIQNGVTITAFLDALGHAVAEGHHQDALTLGDVLTAARAIDAGRRLRG